MAVTLAPRAEDLIREKIAAGPYQTADEVIDEALRLLDERDRQLAALRAEVAIGIEQADRGETVEWTPGRMKFVKQRAIEGWRQGKPISDVVKP